MAAVGIATATAGIIVGTVTLTGIGLVMTEIVEILSGGNIVIMLVLAALICLVLGTGLPTTASYVVVATLMAPVVVELAAQNDLAVPLIAVHMFVFYFGLMADVSPPVGLAAYAAGAIAGADPMKVGWQGMRYEIRTALLPFIFIFNPEILMIDIGGRLHFVMVVGCCVAGDGRRSSPRSQGWFFDAQPLVGDGRAAADLLHAVPPELLARLDRRRPIATHRRARCSPKSEGAGRRHAAAAHRGAGCARRHRRQGVPLLDRRRQHAGRAAQHRRPDGAPSRRHHDDPGRSASAARRANSACSRATKSKPWW